MYSVAFLVPVEDFKNGIVIKADVGVQMLKRTKAYRPKAPPLQIRLKRMWDASLTARTVGVIAASDEIEGGEGRGLSTSFAECRGCPADSADVVVRDAECPMLECALCLGTWHAACAIHHRDALRVQIAAEAPKDLTRSAFPDLLQEPASIGSLDVLCPRCQFLMSAGA